MLEHLFVEVIHLRAIWCKLKFFYHASTLLSNVVILTSKLENYCGICDNVQKLVASFLAHLTLGKLCAQLTAS